MERVALAKAYATTVIDDEIVGVGFGVVNQRWLGLFAITTLESLRRKGIATSITFALACWAQTQGAKKVYLQVEENNRPARTLYHNLGFKTHHVYWYRLLQSEQ